jgi:hypothetical protein
LIVNAPFDARSPNREPVARAHNREITGNVPRAKMFGTFAADWLVRDRRASRGLVDWFMRDRRASRGLVDR